MAEQLLQLQYPLFGGQSCALQKRRAMVYDYDYMYRYGIGWCCIACIIERLLSSMHGEGILLWRLRGRALAAKSMLETLNEIKS